MLKWPPPLFENGSRLGLRKFKPMRNTKMTTKISKAKKPARKAKKTALPVKKKPLTKTQKLQREIAKRNRAFAAADPAGKRVLIAKDVIAQIRAKRFKAKSNRWVTLLEKDNTPIDPHALEHDLGGDAPLRELFLKQTIPACDCCALGAMFMSCTLYNNKTTIDNFNHELAWFEELVETRRFSNGLTSFFSSSQLELIEAAFEGNLGAFTAPANKLDAVESWFAWFPNPKQRMLKIMQNIIDNNGTFVP